ncbi:MAG: DNA repair exonuclease [Bacteroidales bacterium]|jgi:exonuclease SbcD|nr:DNA repair exonuclease [Bacteroidales bacterium]
MLKLLFLADTHLGFDFSIRPKKDRRRRGVDFFANFDRVISYAQENQVDLVIHGGDLFYRTLVPQPIVDMVYERIGNLAESGIPIVIVPGNHESSRLPVSLFLHQPNIYYFTKPEVFNFDLNGVSIDIAGFPCIRKDVKTKFQSVIDSIDSQLSPKKSIKFLCMHQSIEGAVVGPSNYTFRNGKDVIPIESLPENYDLILSGHIHRSQILWTKDRKTPIIYPGSIERTAFAEKEEAKGFYVIEIHEDNSIAYRFEGLPARKMEDIVLPEKLYTKGTLQKEISAKINKISGDSIIRFKMIHQENMNLLTAKFLDDILPWSMNYQIAGDFRSRVKASI